MALYSLLSEIDRKVILFTHEKKYRGSKALANDLTQDEYRAFIITEGDYILWELQKRKLSKAEIIAHSWVVTSKNNKSLIFLSKKIGYTMNHKPIRLTNSIYKFYLLSY